MPMPVGWAITMLFVMVGWVLFRAADFGTAASVLYSLVGGGGFAGKDSERGARSWPRRWSRCWCRPPTRSGTCGRCRGRRSRSARRRSPASACSRSATARRSTSSTFSSEGAMKPPAPDAAKAGTASSGAARECGVRSELGNPVWRRFALLFLGVFATVVGIAYAFIILVDPYDSGRFVSFGLRSPYEGSDEPAGGRDRRHSGIRHGFVRGFVRRHRHLAAHEQRCARPFAAVQRRDLRQFARPASQPRSGSPARPGSPSSNSPCRARTCASSSR